MRTDRLHAFLVVLGGICARCAEEVGESIDVGEYLGLRNVGAGQKKHHALVIGGFTKKHCMSMAPIVKELADNDFAVTFVVPGDPITYKWFDKVPLARIMHLGHEGFMSAEKVIGTNASENLGPWGRMVQYINLLYNIENVMHKIVYSQYLDLQHLLRSYRPDVTVVSFMNFGALDVLRNSNWPYVVFFDTSPYSWLEPRVVSSGRICRYPYATFGMVAPKVSELKASLIARLKNHMICSFEMSILPLLNRAINNIRRNYSLPPVKSITDYFVKLPTVLVVGGPPFSVNYKLGRNVHLVGSIEKVNASLLSPMVLKSWLDAAKKAKAPVLYMYLGSKFALPRSTAARFPAVLQSIISMGVRVLWSLTADQQKMFKSQLPMEGEHLRIERFPPQRSLLQHSAVKAFVSHCSLNGVIDGLSSLVPLLMYAKTPDELQNAGFVEDMGVGIRLQANLSDLPQAVDEVLRNKSFVIAARKVGRNLSALGGLDHAMHVVYSTFDVEKLGKYPETLVPHAPTDPFFDETDFHVLAIEAVLVLSLGCLWLPIALCCYCFLGQDNARRRETSRHASRKKEQ